MYLYARKKKNDQPLRAPSSVGRYNSTRVDAGRKCGILVAIKMKARTVVGRGEEGPLCDRVTTRRERERSARIISEMKKYILQYIYTYTNYTRYMVYIIRYCPPQKRVL